MSSLNDDAQEWKPSSSTAAWTPAAVTIPLLKPKSFIAIDVECVATGKSHKDRAVGLIAAVDPNENTIFFEYVKPDQPVASPMTLLTGITRDKLESARPLIEVLKDLKELLGNNCVLVGHGLKSDIAWLQLQEGVDYSETRDTAKLFAVRTPKNNSVMTPSLRHLSLCMFGIDMQSGIHSPAADALYAMKLWQLHSTFSEPQLMQASQVILNTPRPPPFAKRYPYIDGCELSNRSTKFAAALALTHPSHIIFLDIDGVLNKTRKSDEIHLEEEFITNLSNALESYPHQVGIVLSSFWRCFQDYIEYVLKRKGLKNFIICGTTTLEGKTALTKQIHDDQQKESGEQKGNDGSDKESPWSVQSKKRSDEIVQYLYEHPEITNYTIVDDRLTASNEIVSKHFVLTESTQGLTNEKVEEMLKALGVLRYV